jgi:hypothetical protein
VQITIFESMKKWFLLAVILSTLLFVACKKDDVDLNPQNAVNVFVGKWSRDTVIVYEIVGSNQNIVSKEIAAGTYTFKPDSTGFLNLNGSDKPITWEYQADQDRIIISEQGWVNQSYLVDNLSASKFKLTGNKFVGSTTVRRVIYLTRIN